MKIPILGLAKHCDNRNIALMLEPARTVIEICGGFAATARLADRDTTRVHRWTYPKERGGTGGLIPADCQVALLKAAKDAGIDLRPEHFFTSSPTDEAAA